MKINPYRRTINLICLLFLIFITNLATGQNLIRNSYITGAKKGALDTNALENSQRIAKVTSGLLENEIDPDKYILGPNDILNITIISSKSKELEVKVSPEGKILIPLVGSVDVKGKTLSEAYKLIQDMVKRIYKVEEVNVVLDRLRDFKVTVTGYVFKPAMVSATAADRVSEVLDKAGGLKFDASIRRISLLRNNGKENIRVDLLRYYRAGDKNANPTVFGGDIILVPPCDESQKIEIFGEVASPEAYEFVEGDSLSLLFKFALGYLKSALLDSVEISRFNQKGDLKTWVMDLSSWKNIYYSDGKLPNDIPLEAGDRIFVRKNSEHNDMFTVCINGEVKYPGYYAVKKNEERISDLINRAGGFTETASLETAEFYRKKEFKVKDDFMERLWRISKQDMSEDEKKYFEARNLEKRGIMSLDLKRVLNDKSSIDNVILDDEDSLYVPPQKVYVNVQGRVNKPGFVIYKPNYNYLDYIELAGGFGYRADEGGSLVVKSKGELFSANSSRYVLEPGDNILVPPKTEITFTEVATTLLTVITQIITIFGVIYTVVRLK